MDRNKIKLFLHTVKYLKLKQIYYQVYYLIRNRIFKNVYEKELKKEIQPLSWSDCYSYPDSFKKDNNFTFLNLSYQFSSKIDWNYDKHGKLWTYNLNYFDFLNQKEITVTDGLKLIKDFQANEDYLKDGKEPYPISLRGINWIKFLSKNTICDSAIDQTLYNHYHTLIHNLEYHLLGNHLLENGYALLFGAYYFKDEILYKNAKRILIQELTEQVLNDGAHFELSPMYHQILLHRLLDCINLLKKNPWKKDTLLPFLEGKATQMLSWLQTITYSNGNIPMVNDSAYNIAPSSHELFEYGNFLGLHWKKISLSDCGYRVFKNDNYEFFIDVGTIGPKYQPGHAHSDTFSFELYMEGKPIIVDVGTSTYEKNELRLKERETASHNTIKIGDQEQSKVWDGFRVAQRANIVNIKEETNRVEATHNGYKKLDILHTRTFYAKDSEIIIEDTISKKTNKEQTAFFHFHPNIEEVQVFNNKVNLLNENIQINFDKQVVKIEQEEYDYALGFNKREKAKKIKVYFDTSLSTSISNK